MQNPKTNAGQLRNEGFNDIILHFFFKMAAKNHEIVGSNNFSAQFIKIISHYKKIGYKINVLQQTACLVVNQITVGNFAFLFNCMPMGRTSDSIMIPILRLIYWWDGRGLMLWLFVGPTRVYLLDFFCSGIQFYLLSLYLCFISSLYLDLCV